MKNLGKVMNGNTAGKLTGIAIGTMATIKGNRANSLVGIIMVAGALYVAKRIVAKTKADYDDGVVNEDFLGGALVGLVGTAFAGAVVTKVIGDNAPTVNPVSRC